MNQSDELLKGVSVVCVAAYIPANLAAARLRAMGATITVVVQPTGDALRQLSPAWYDAIHRGNRHITLDLKSEADRARLAEMLDTTDILFTALRPRALARLGLDSSETARRHPQLCQVMIVGDASPNGDRPGHDLTYQARAGLVTPPDMPRSLLADLFGAERAAFAAISLLLGRDRGHSARRMEISLTDVAAELAAPWEHGLTSAGGTFNGGHAGYGVYRASDGWVAVAALEPHFFERLLRSIGVSSTENYAADLSALFAMKSASEWERWALELDLPLVAVRS